MSIVAAVTIHVLVFWSWPGLPVRPLGEAGRAGDAVRAIRLLAELEAPESPAPIRKPAEPSIPEAELTLESDDLSIEPIEFDDPKVGEIPELPPAPPAEEVRDGYRHWTPMMVRPALKNPHEVRRELQRRYPPHLVNRGVTGRVVMLFWIDETGEVERYEIQQSSGNAALDRAAEDVVEAMEFQPAVQNGEAVKVIVALPITFQVR